MVEKRHHPHTGSKEIRRGSEVVDEAFKLCWPPRCQHKLLNNQVPLSSPPDAGYVRLWCSGQHRQQRMQVKPQSQLEGLCRTYAQLRKATLIIQTAIRYVENLTIEKGVLMVTGPPDKETEDGAEQLVKTSGTGFRVYRKKIEEGKEEEQLRYAWSGEATGVLVDNTLLNYLNDKVLDKVEKKEVFCSSLHKRESVIFRAHPCYHGRPWNDFALFDWGKGQDQEIGMIHSFVCIGDLLPGEKITVNESEVVENGVYALIHTLRWVDANGDPYRNRKHQYEDNAEKPNIVRRLRRRTDESGEPLLVLADVNVILETATVVPNIGSNSHAFFYVEKRSVWKEQWVLVMDYAYKTRGSKDNLAEEDFETNTKRNNLLLASLGAVHDYNPTVDWCLLTEDHTILVPQNIERTVESMSKTKNTSVYMGKCVQTGHQFIMGGSGILLSGDVVRKLRPGIDKCRRKFYSYQYGDTRIAKCLDYLDIMKFHSETCATLYFTSGSAWWEASRKYAANMRFVPLHKKDPHKIRYLNGAIEEMARKNETIDFRNLRPYLDAFVEESNTTALTTGEETSRSTSPSLVLNDSAKEQ